MHTYITVVFLSLLSIASAGKIDLPEANVISPNGQEQISAKKPSADPKPCAGSCSSDRGSGRVNRYTDSDHNNDYNKERGSGRFEDKTPKNFFIS